MELNHVNVSVSDVAAARAFMERYFEMESRFGTDGIAVLIDDDGFVLTLMNTGGESSMSSPGHLGFFIESEDTVDDLHRRLDGDDFDVTKTAVRHGRYGFYVEAPGGFNIEVGA